MCQCGDARQLDESSPCRSSIKTLSLSFRVIDTGASMDCFRRQCLPCTCVVLAVAASPPFQGPWDPAHLDIGTSMWDLSCAVNKLSRQELGKQREPFWEEAASQQSMCGRDCAVSAMLRCGSAQVSPNGPNSKLACASPSAHSAEDRPGSFISEACMHLGFACSAEDEGGASDQTACGG